MAENRQRDFLGDRAPFRRLLRLAGAIRRPCRGDVPSRDQFVYPCRRLPAPVARCRFGFLGRARSGPSSTAGATRQCLELPGRLTSRGWMRSISVFRRIRREGPSR
jgi:hypothetical protein